MTFIIVCGGTAGHINPGLAIAQALQEQEPAARILFIGSDRDMEKRLIPRAGYELINIKMSGIRRSVSPGAVIYNIKTLINVKKANRRAAEIFRNEKPDAVIGTGGYICYPVIKTAAKHKIPAFIHESNARPGLAVRLLSGVAAKVMITYEGYEKYYKHPEKIIVTGTPVRKEFIENAGRGSETVAVEKEKDEKPLVVSFWGSLGAEKMNGIMAGFIEKNLTDKRFYHIHATGNSRQSLMNKLYESGITQPEPPYADIREYIDDMPQVMDRADLVLCRAGANTIAELTALGKPGILIPSPYVPDNVQKTNAEQLETRAAAIVINESECSADKLYRTVSDIVKDSAGLKKMSEAAKTLAAPSAAQEIAGIILNNIR